MAQSQNVMALLDRAIRSGPTGVNVPRRVARSGRAMTLMVKVSRSDANYYTMTVAPGAVRAITGG